MEQLLRPSRLVVPVVGAGVAQSAGLPGTTDLARRLLAASERASDYRGSHDSLAQVVDFLTPAHGDGESALLAAAAAEIATCRAERSPLVEALVRVPSRFIVALNFDLTLEEAEARRGHSSVTLGNSREDLAEAMRILCAEQVPSQLTVLHLHGSIEKPAEIVLATDGYKRLASEPFRQLLYELAVHRTLVFYGTMLDEPYLLAELQRLENRGSHVLWCLESDKDELTSARGPILPSRSGIYVRPVREFADLPATVSRLLHVDLPPAPPVVVPRAADDGGLYVENCLRDRRNPIDPQDLALVSFGLEPKRDLIPDPTEADVLDAQRTIVLGEPGTGKSELLKQLMRRTRPPRSGVFIRLADVELDPQPGPRQTLAAWARRGVSAEEGLDVSADTLAQGRYHFLLDGLDEVASDRQADVAAKVNELAEEFPRHAFTVSTRPLPSLELLQIEAPEGMDWNQFTLAPDSQWRDRFLAQRGVSLQALYDDMPALEDMVDVLTTPFYLSHIVDLHEEGRLRGLPDFSRLLSTLIDSAIAREQSALGVGDTAIRAWLRDLALAAVIAGRRTFSEQTLRRFDLPPAYDADALDLARALEQRLLLAEDRGSFRFHHRLLGEQLAAEALGERGPLPELLDCLVPYVDKALSGVRPDAVVPVSLACLDSAEWRDAVAERDPLLAARCAPANAPAEEREAALRTLWRNATSKQVWVWERGMQLTDDADAMGRLLRTVPESPAASEISAAIESGTAQDQGNAIRVLTRARSEGLERILTRVLGTRGRNEVVLRQASLAAADCGFVDLAEDIVEMLLGESEETVHKTGIAALSNLLGDEHRLDLYLRLMASPEAGYLIVLVLDDLEPADAVVLLAEYLRHDSDDGHDPFWAKDKIPTVFEGLELDKLEPAVLEAAVDVAVSFGVDRERIAAFAAADSTIVIRRLAELFSGQEFRWWKAIELAALFDPTDLSSAGLPDHVVDRVRPQREIDAGSPDAAPSDVSPEHGGATGDAGGEEEENPPTLGELLDGQETDALILNNTQYFAPQIGDLSEEQLRELRTRLARWWPQKPYQETITRTSPNSWRQDADAHAWIWFGPEAKPDLSAEQWAQLATCGVLFESQTEWLEATQTLEGIYRAVELLGTDGDVERWDQLLSCCADPLPNRALVACFRSLDSSLTERSDTVAYRLRNITRRMIDNGRFDLAKDLAERHTDFVGDLAPILAEKGDLGAQRHLLASLVEQLSSEGEIPDERRVEWLPGVRSPELLPCLFDVVKQTYKTETPQRMTIRGFDRSDIARTAMEAITAIGGRQAVEGYDELIASEEDFRWLHHQRSQLAGAVLAADGERFGSAAAARAELPWLGEARE